MSVLKKIDSSKLRKIQETDKSARDMVDHANRCTYSYVRRDVAEANRRAPWKLPGVQRRRARKHGSHSGVRLHEGLGRKKGKEEHTVSSVRITRKKGQRD